MFFSDGESVSFVGIISVIFDVFQHLFDILVSDVSLPPTPPKVLTEGPEPFPCLNLPSLRAISYILIFNLNMALSCK